MNPAQLSALFAAHKTAILGTAAAGVAGLALYRKKKGTGASAQPAGTIPAAAVVSAGGTTGGGGYDSSAYDVYAALQSELEPILQQQQAGKQTGGAPGGGVVTAPKPVTSPILSQPKPPAKPAPAPVFADGWYRPAGANSIYQISNHGTTRDWLNLQEATALGFSTKNNKGLHVVSADDTRWKATKLLGIGPKTIQSTVKQTVKKPKK